MGICGVATGLARHLISLCQTNELKYRFYCQNHACFSRIYLSVLHRWGSTSFKHHPLAKSLGQKSLGLDWNSWFFTRWVPGLTIPFWNKITDGVSTQEETEVWGVGAGSSSIPHSFGSCMLVRSLVACFTHHNCFALRLHVQQLL